MKVTLITPIVGRKKGQKYLRTWQMEPLPIAALIGLTPKDIEIEYFDERLEPIDFETKTNLVGISVETYNARRAYQIADEFHKRGVRVVMGGFHVSLAPEEVAQHADAIVVGYAEKLWSQVLADARKNQLQKIYQQVSIQETTFAMPDRSLFKGKPYFSLHSLETSRGCPYTCNFCAITAMSKGSYITRPIDEVLKDLESLDKKFVFIVDDNVVGDQQRSYELFKAMKGSGKKWVSQGTITAANNPKLLRAMSDSGCVGILVGFESINPEILKSFGKSFNVKAGDYIDAAKKFTDHGIALYGTFTYGHDLDKLGDLPAFVDMAIESKMYIAAFNHLIPFPGTKLYKDLVNDGRLNPAWWLDPDFRFGDVPYQPNLVSAEEVRDACRLARKKFYSLGSIAKRSTNFKANLNSIQKGISFFTVNYLMRREVDQRIGLPLGEI